jgi:hypothetical protein
MKGSRASAAHGRGGRAIGFVFVSVALGFAMSTSSKLYLLA